MSNSNAMTVEELNSLLSARPAQQAPRTQGAQAAPIQAQEPISVEELNRLTAPPPPPSVGFREDVARSVGSGLAQGAMGLVGLPGTIESLGRSGARYMGYDVAPETVLPTTEKVKGFVESSPAIKSYTSYDPQYSPSRYLKTAAEFLPGALAGPGGLAVKTAGSLGAGFATQGVEDALKKTALEGTGTEAALKLAASIPGYMAGTRTLSAVKAPVSGLITPGREAEKRIADTLQRDVLAGGKTGASMSPEAALASGAEVLPAALAGKRTQGLIQQSAERVGEEAQGAFAAAAGKARGTAPTTVADDIDRIFNTNVNPFDRQALLQREGAQINSQNYLNLMTSPAAQAVGNPALASVLTRIPDPTILNRVGQTLNMFGDNPAALGMVSARGRWTIDPNQPVHLRVWDQLKKELDSQIGSLKDPMTGNVTDATRFAGLNSINAALKKNLDTAIPQYAVVRGAAAEYAGAQNAIDLGMKYLTARDPATVRNIESIMRSSTPGKSLLPEHREDVAYGMMGAFKRMLTESDQTASQAFKMLTGPGSKETIRRMETALAPMGPDVAQAFIGRSIAAGLNRQIQDLKPTSGFNLRSTVVPSAAGIAGAAIQMGENLLQFSLGSMSPQTAAAAITGVLGGKFFNWKEKRVAERVLEYMSDPAKAARLAQLVRDDPSARTFLGKVQGVLERGVKYPAGVSASMADTPAPAGQAAGGRIQRASGGRISPEAMADRIMGQIDKARKELQAQTGTLLNHDDETIVKALKVANERI